MRWVGTAKGCSDPCPDFSGVNNYKRMMVAADMVGGMQDAVDMRWLLDGTHPPAMEILPKPVQRKGRFGLCFYRQGS